MEVKIRPVSPRTSPSFCTLRRQRREARRQMDRGHPLSGRAPAALTAPNPLLAPVPSMWTSDRLGCRRVCFTRANYSKFQRFYFITLHRYFPKHNILHFPRHTLFNSLLAMSLRYKKGTWIFTFLTQGSDVTPSDHIRNDCSVQQQGWLNKLRYIHSTDYYTAGKGKGGKA